MARTVAELPKGSRITDYISLGVLNTMIPRTAVDAALEASSRQSIRQRDLPAHVMVYYVIALALYMQSSYREVLRCLLEGLQWLSDPSARPRVVGRSGISQARTRLGAEPLQALHDAVVRPVGRSSEPGCGYRRWHLVSIDGSGLDVADEQGNADAFGRPGASRGRERLPADSVCLVGRERDSCSVWQPPGGLCSRRTALGPGRGSGPVGRHAVLGGPQLFQLPAVESGPRNRGGSVVAHQEESAPAAGDAVG